MYFERQILVLRAVPFQDIYTMRVWEGDKILKLKKLPLLALGNKKYIMFPSMSQLIFKQLIAQNFIYLVSKFLISFMCLMLNKCLDRWQKGFYFKQNSLRQRPILTAVTDVCPLNFLFKIFLFCLGKQVSMLNLLVPPHQMLLSGKWSNSVSRCGQSLERTAELNNDKAQSSQRRQVLFHFNWQVQQTADSHFWRPFLD